MNTRPPVITPAELEEWKARINPNTGKRWTEAEIGRELGRTRQQINNIKYMTDRFSRTPREQAKLQYPLRPLAKPWRGTGVDKRLRDHMEYMATNGEGMSHIKLRDLYGFLRKLRDRNLVVVFDPNIAADDEGSATPVGGFAYRPRKARDGTLVIRDNEFTNITNDNIALLEMPDELPLSKPPRKGGA